MNKISKLLTIFALCGLFTISNTSGIEEKMPNQKHAISYASPPIDFVSGQWYSLNLHESYVDDVIPLIPITREIDYGLHYSLSNDYFDCYKFDFGNYSFKSYFGNDLSNTFYYDYLFNIGETISICFYDYVPNSLINYYKYFIKEDNSSYSKVYLKEDINLLTSKFEPLIYLGGPIFDNTYSQVPTDYGSPYFDLTIFEGRFASGGIEYSSIVLTYQNWAGVRYTWDNGESYNTGDATADTNFRYGIRDISYVFNGVKTSIISYDIVSVGGAQKAVVRPYTYRFAGNEKLTIYEYSTLKPLSVLPSYNYYELLKLRPSITVVGDDFVDGEGGLLGGAFGLIGLVFTSLAGFLSFQILPGLTLGLLILIPLVITIIVLIFKVVK